MADIPPTDSQPTDPSSLFDAWFAEARAHEPNDPEAMALATVDAAGQPSVRMVLLKGHDERGFVFYTNREGRKAADLAAVPRAALMFHWKSLRRQVRIEGPVSRASDAESDAYFASRGRDSRLGAWASDQSRPLAELNAQLARQGFYKAFPPPGIEVVSWNVVMGIGQIVVLRLPATRIREINRVLEDTAWGAYRTEFFPTYDYKAVGMAEHEKAR